MVKYINQSYKELNYSLSKERSTDINILKIKKLEWNNLSIELSIIGASHHININNQLFELFATTKLNNCETFFNFNQIKDINYICNNFNYSFKIIDKIDITNCDLEFNYIFPGDNNPETKIFLKKFNRYLIIETLHNYPNETVTVYTETKIELL